MAITGDGTTALALGLIAVFHMWRSIEVGYNAKEEEEADVENVKVNEEENITIDEDNNENVEEEEDAALYKIDGKNVEAIKLIVRILRKRRKIMLKPLLIKLMGRMLRILLSRLIVRMLRSLLMRLMVRMPRKKRRMKLILRMISKKRKKMPQLMKPMM